MRAKEVSDNWHCLDPGSFVVQCGCRCRPVIRETTGATYVNNVMTDEFQAAGASLAAFVSVVDGLMAALASALQAVDKWRQTSLPIV